MCCSHPNNGCNSNNVLANCDYDTCANLTGALLFDRSIECDGKISKNTNAPIEFIVKKDSSPLMVALPMNREDDLGFT